MPHTRDTLYYYFDELPTDAAKDRARDWYRQHWEAADLECALDDILGVLEMLGFTVDRKDLHWSGFGNQGDGLSFAGEWEYRKGSVQAIAAHAPQDQTLQAIARDLAQLQRAHFYTLTVELTRSSSRYCHEHTVDINEAEYRTTPRQHIRRTLDEGTRAEVLDVCRRLMRWGYQQLEAEYDYQQSNEAVDESIRANEYEFTEDGRHA